MNNVAYHTKRLFAKFFPRDVEFRTMIATAIGATIFIQLPPQAASDPVLDDVRSASTGDQQMESIGKVFNNLEASYGAYRKARDAYEIARVESLTKTSADEKKAIVDQAAKTLKQNEKATINMRTDFFNAISFAKGISEKDGLMWAEKFQKLDGRGFAHYFDTDTKYFMSWLDECQNVYADKKVEDVMACMAHDAKLQMTPKENLTLDAAIGAGMGGLYLLGGALARRFRRETGYETELRKRNQGYVIKSVNVVEKIRRD